MSKYKIGDKVRIKSIDMVPVVRGQDYIGCFMVQ